MSGRRLVDRLYSAAALTVSSQHIKMVDSFKYILIKVQIGQWIFHLVLMFFF